MSAQDQMPVDPLPTPQNMVVVETTNVDGANADGSITANAGQTVTLVEYDNRGNGMAYLSAVGAADALNCTYALKVEEDTVFSTESPLGTIVNPFSFSEKMGHPLPVGDRVRYEATYNGTGSVNLAGRMILLDV
jgi:hypothetical protein